MTLKTIPSNIKNLSQLLDDGLILCDKLGVIISSNSIAQQFLNKKLNKKNISEFIKIDEFKNLEESHANGNLNDEFHFQTNDILKRSLITKVCFGSSSLVIILNQRIDF